MGYLISTVEMWVEHYLEHLKRPTCNRVFTCSTSLHRHQEELNHGSRLPSPSPVAAFSGRRLLTCVTGRCRRISVLLSTTAVLRGLYALRWDIQDTCSGLLPKVLASEPEFQLPPACTCWAASLRWLPPFPSLFIILPAGVPWGHLPCVLLALPPLHTLNGGHLG